MAKLVAVLSGPERTRAKTEVALEDAHLPILPSDHHAIGRQSYSAEHWDGYLTQLPSGDEPDEAHGFVAVVADGADELNRAVQVVEKHGWVLRVHGELPPEPKPDPLRSLLEEYERRIAHLESRLTSPPMRGGSVESPPWATQAGSFPAEQTRRAVFANYARTAANTPGILAGGLLSSADIQIAAPVSGLSVNISTGEAIVGGTEGGTQGGYYGRVSSTTNLVISTANASNPRIDTVCMTVADAAYTIPTGGSSGNVTLQVVTGTATSGATLTNLTGAATLPGSSLLLGYVLVPASATNIITADVSNRATVALPLSTTWITIPLSSNWSVTTNCYTPSFRVAGGVVYLSGTATNGTGSGSTTPFTSPLPAGMRPASQVTVSYGIPGSSEMGPLTIAAAGTYTAAISVNNAGTASVDGVAYRIF